MARQEAEKFLLQFAKRPKQAASAQGQGATWPVQGLGFRV